MLRDSAAIVLGGPVFSYHPFLNLKFQQYTKVDIIEQAHLCQAWSTMTSLWLNLSYYNPCTYLFLYILKEISNIIFPL